MTGKKKQFSVRLPPDTAEKMERYCDERGLSYADALRRFTEKELLREQKKEIVQTDGGLTKKENPWIGPLEKFAWVFTLAGIVGTIALISYTVPQWILGQPVFADVFYPLVTFSLLSSALGGGVIAALEYVTHPYDAPIRKYFKHRHPEV